VRDPVVLGDAEVAAELVRLCGALRAARVTAGVSTREAAAAAEVNLGTLWPLEQARNRPTFLVFARLAEVAGATLELEDQSAGKPLHRLRVGQGWPLPPGYQLGPAMVYADWSPQKRGTHQRMHSTRARLGAELWWARLSELAEPLDGASACRLLGMSHHTLAAVEFGPDWPDLASVVRVAGLTGRRVVLTSMGAGLRLPPWA
jgi:transcriptional regulator with XRE-family HTH domain